MFGGVAASEATLAMIVGDALERHEISSLLRHYNYNVKSAADAWCSLGLDALPVAPQNKEMDREQGAPSKRPRIEEHAQMHEERAEMSAEGASQKITKSSRPPESTKKRVALGGPVVEQVSNDERRRQLAGGPGIGHAGCAACGPAAAADF